MNGCVNDEQEVFLDCNFNANPADNYNAQNDNQDLWFDEEPLQEDLNNNNNNNNNIHPTEPEGQKQGVDLQRSSDDFLFDTNYIESAMAPAMTNVDNLAFLKTTHVTGHGVSCEVAVSQREMRTHSHSS